MTKKKRYIPWRDIWWFGATILIAVAATVAAVLTPQEWKIAEILIMLFVLSALIGISIAGVLVQYSRGWDFMLEDYPAYVWTNGIDVIKRPMIKNALFLLLKNFPRRTNIANFEEIMRALSGCTIEFRQEPISLMGLGWAVEGKAGIQKRKSIIVHWKGSIEKSAFYHEILHLIDENALRFRMKDPGKWRPDYKHENEELWRLEPILNQLYVEHERERGDQ